MKKAVKIERFLLFILPILFFFINLFFVQLVVWLIWYRSSNA